MDDPQYLSLCCARYILLSILSIQTQGLKLHQNFDLKAIVQVLDLGLFEQKFWTRSLNQSTLWAICRNLYRARKSQKLVINITTSPIMHLPCSFAQINISSKCPLFVYKYIIIILINLIVDLNRETCIWWTLQPR